MYPITCGWRWFAAMRSKCFFLGVLNVFHIRWSLHSGLLVRNKHWKQFQCETLAPLWTYRIAWQFCCSLSYISWAQKKRALKCSLLDFNIEVTAQICWHCWSCCVCSLARSNMKARRLFWSERVHAGGFIPMIKHAFLRVAIHRAPSLLW